MKNEIGELALCYWGFKKIQKGKKNNGIGTIEIG